MGRGRKWTSEERPKLALAWSRTSMNPVHGRNQRSDVFVEKVFESFKEEAPPNPELGTYYHRSSATVMNFWRNVMAPDIMKFNEALKKVYAAKPSEVDEQQKINMARG